MSRLAALGLPMSVPLETGVSQDGTQVWTLFTFIEGEDAETALPRLPEDRQYALGLRAGELLKSIHTLPAPAAQEPWEPRFNRKLDRNRERYLACGIRFEHDTDFWDCIDRSRPLLAGRPQCFQHGDYHCGNLIVGPDGLSVIDFNRFDFGDPWEEFNRIVWCAAVSPAFACGRINGYFGGRPPEEFFRLLRLYIAANCIGSIPWAILFGQAEIDTMQNQTKQVWTWYNEMKDPVPVWYR